MKKKMSKMKNLSLASFFSQKNNQKSTSAVLIFTYFITFLFPVMSVSSQAVVPLLNDQPFQNQNLSNIYAVADQEATSLDHWDKIVNTHLYQLYSDWQLASEAKIAAYVSSVNTSDAYNTVQAYQQYVYQALQSQKAIEEQNWMQAAETSIQLRRESFLASNTQSTLNSSEVNSSQGQTDLGINPNQNVIQQAQEAVRIAREQWERDHADGIANGLLQYDNAISSSNNAYNNLVSKIATTDAQFNAQIANIKGYEKNVRDQIGIQIGQLQSYLSTNSVFYNTDANGAPIIDVNQLTSDGQQLQALIVQMQGAIANKSPLSTIANLMKNYLISQETVAAGNQTYWNGKIYSSSNFNNTIFAANVGNNYSSHDVIGAIKAYYDNGKDIAGLKTFINQKLGLNTSYKYTQTVSAVDMTGNSSNYNPYPVTVNSWGKGESYSTAGNNAFTYAATGCGFWGVLICVSQDFLEEKVTTSLSFTTFDSNASANKTAWVNYSSALVGKVSTWNSSVVPAISNWESQVNSYTNEYASWKAQSVSILAQAALARDKEVSDLSESRATWLSKMEALRQDGEVTWTTTQNTLKEKADSIQEAITSGLSGNDLVSLIASKSSDLVSILSALPVKTDIEVESNLITRSGMSFPSVSDSFLSASNSFLNDLAGLRLFLSTLNQSVVGAQNFALANSLNSLAKKATSDGMSQVYNSLAASGAGVSYDANGNIVVTQSIYNGQANLRAGADATSASSYDAGMSNYSTVVMAPQSFRLASTGDLFDSWDNSQIFNDFQSSSEQFSRDFQRVTTAMSTSLNNVGKMSERGAEAYQASANSQASNAQLVKSLAETLFMGGTVQSWARSQAEGYVKSQIAQAISNATGGAVSADLIVAFLNKRQADKARREAARKKTIQVVATVVAVVAAVVITVVTCGAGAPAAGAGVSAVAGGGAAAAGGTAAAAGGTAAAAGGTAAAAGGTAAAAGGTAVAAGTFTGAVASAASAVGTFITTTLPAIIVNIPTVVVASVNAVVASTPAMIAVGVNTAVQTAAGYELGGNNGALAGFINGASVAGGPVGINVTQQDGHFGASIGVSAGGVTAGVGVSPTGSVSGSVGVTVGGAGRPGVGVSVNTNGQVSGNISIPFTANTGFGATFGNGQPTQVNLTATTGNGTSVQVGTSGLNVSNTSGNTTTTLGVDTNGNLTGNVSGTYGSATGNYGVSFGSGQPTTVTASNGSTNLQIGPDGLAVTNTTGGSNVSLNVGTDGTFTGSVSTTNPSGTYGVSFGSGQSTTVTASNGSTNVQVGADGASVTSTNGGVTTVASVDANGNVNANVSGSANGTNVQVGTSGASLTNTTGGVTTTVGVDSSGNVTGNVSGNANGTNVQVGTSGASVTNTTGGVTTTVVVDSSGNVTGNVSGSSNGTNVQVGTDGASISTDINGNQVTTDSNGNTTINGSTPSDIVNSIDLNNPLTFGISQEAFADLTAGLSIDETNEFVDFVNSNPDDLAALGLTGMLGAYLFTIGRKEEEDDRETEEEVEEEEAVSSVEDSEEPTDPPATDTESNSDVVVTERGKKIRTLNDDDLVGNKMTFIEAYHKAMETFVLENGGAEKARNFLNGFADPGKTELLNEVNEKINKWYKDDVGSVEQKTNNEMLRDEYLAKKYGFAEVSKFKTAKNATARPKSVKGFYKTEVKIVTATPAIPPNVHQAADMPDFRNKYHYDNGKGLEDTTRVEYHDFKEETDPANPSKKIKEFLYDDAIDPVTKLPLIDEATGTVKKVKRMAVKYVPNEGKYKVDLGLGVIPNYNQGQGSMWYGPNTSFKVLEVAIEGVDPKKNNPLISADVAHGTRIRIALLNEKGEISSYADLVHLTTISKEITDALESKKPLPAGTWLGATPKKIGSTTGAHLHIKSFGVDYSKGTPIANAETMPRSDFYDYWTGKK